jgi:hypothetical protein
MSSIPSVASIIKSLTSLDLYKQQPTTPGDTTTTSALARLATTIPVAAITNFADTEPFFIIGDGGTELNTVSGAPSGSNIVPATPIALAQSSGARVLEALKYPLGHIGEGSAKITGSSTTVPIPAATSATPIGFLSTGGALGFAFSLLSADARTLALAFGQDELETGAGTAADPWTTVISQLTVGTHALACLRGRALRKDGKIVLIDMLDCTVTVAADFNFAGKAVSPIAVAGSCTSHIVRFW